MAPKKYIHQITFLRFIAAFTVLVFHFGLQTYPFNLQSVKPVVANGALAVSFFFFLSGYLLTFNIPTSTKLDIGRFYKRRFARIFPLYWLCFLVTLILVIVVKHQLPKGISIILQALGLHAWMPGICLEINFPSWSVAVEIFFYLSFPLWLRWINKTKMSYAIAWVLFIWAISNCLHYYLKTGPFPTENNKFGQFILYFPVWHLSTFLMGMITSKIVLKIQGKKQLNNIIIQLLLILSLVLLIALHLIPNKWIGFAHNGLLSPVFGLLLATVTLSSSATVQWLGFRPFVLLGDASYALYLLQYPVYLLYTTITQQKSVAGLHFWYYSGILILVSVLIYLFYEKPIKSRMLKKWNP